ncbi:MAG: NADH-quinone oxidoreductase subunit J [Planctomycetaceae bacterium]
MSGAEILFTIFALTTCLGAIAVVVSQNVVRMAFWLMVSLGSVAGLFFLLRADFVAAAQLLIYVGGTVVLLVFGVMLTASGRFVKIRTSPAEGFLGAGIGSLFLAILIATVGTESMWTGAARQIEHGFVAGEVGRGHNAEASGNTTRPIANALMWGRPDKDLGKGGNETLSTVYLLPFEIVSVHLLVVLIGAAYLARAKKRVDREDD